MSQQPSEPPSQSAPLPSAATDFEARGAFYGRRIGKTLRGLQQDALTHLLPRYKVDLDAASVPASLFPEPRQGYWLEIGCGCGEHLIDHAARRPEMGFIGAEPFLNGLARMLVDLDARSLANVRVFDLDAALLLDRLPTASLDGVDLFYPDPWPKKRHWKRRFVRPDNLDRLARVIRPGGVFRFASDVPHYVGWTLAHVRAHSAFTWTAQRADDWRKPYPFWPGTRYEAKAIAQGRVPTYLTFVRR